MSAITVRKSSGHPEWCARGHHCTAPTGEHASVPEVWQTDAGRIVATRYRSASGRDRIEVRTVARLPEGEPGAQAYARLLIALAGDSLRRAAGAL